MDTLIRRFDASQDSDLMLCEHRGVAYQADMSKGRVQYDAKYLSTFESPEYTQSSTANAVNAGRCALVSRHVEKGASIVDVGAGSGAFLKVANWAGYDANGYDVIPRSNDRLRLQQVYSDDYESADVVTMWDSLEHMEDPGRFLMRCKKGAFLFVSLPVFDDIRLIRKSKHYKPGEHLYYWTAKGFVDYAALCGFRLLEESAHETAAGRDCIGAFAFIKDLPDRRDFIAQYQEMHSRKHYGSSATELHLDRVADAVRTLQPRSILDYGCGRSDLVSHFWLDGKRRIGRYDPAIPKFRHMPEGKFDLALVCDVMEHIPMHSVDRVLEEIRSKSEVAFFTISTRPARAKLPNGMNAHCTLLTASEWKRWIASMFKPLDEVICDMENELVLVAGALQQERRAA